MSVEQVKSTLESTLNPEILTMDSIYGILIVIGIVWLIIRGFKKVTSSFGSIIGFILFLYFAYILAFNTDMGIWFPTLKTIFKYDVLTALAQLCVGTPVANVLLYIQAWLNTVMLTVMDRIIHWIIPFFHELMHMN